MSGWETEWWCDENNTPRSEWQECDCGRGRFDPAHYSSCYECFVDRAEGYTSCIYCGRWHAAEYPTCFKCGGPSGPRAEAAKNLRQYILWRDGYRCCDCGVLEADLQVDHIRPCRAGGNANPWNLQALCRECNRLKGGTWSPIGHWARKRRDLLVQYFYFWRSWLDDAQRAALRQDIERERTGFSW